MKTRRTIACLDCGAPTQVGYYSPPDDSGEQDVLRVRVEELEKALRVMSDLDDATAVNGKEARGYIQINRERFLRALGVVYAALKEPDAKARPR